MMQRRPWKSSVLSRPFWEPSPPITKFANNLLPRVLLRRTHFQESVAVGNKTKVLLSHIVVLEERFDSLPGVVEEQRRRDKVIEYVIASP
jgi:hypothetical protein